MAVDYTKFGDGKAPADKLAEGLKRKWWACDTEEETFESITATIQHLQRRQSARLTQYVIGARLYGNLSVLSYGGLSQARLMSALGAYRDRISYNVVQSAIDTVNAKIGKNKPRPYFLTSGGDYKLQRKAKKLNQFIDGVFYENDAYALGSLIFRDAAVFGDGLVHVFVKEKRICFERTIASELWIDEIEGFYNQPRNMHRVKNIDRQLVLDTFGKDEKLRKLILDCNSAKQDESGEWQTISDLITVRESWHLPSSKKAKDGKHIISIDNAVLFEEPYKQTCFPFARFSWCPRLYGFWAQGLAEQLQNIQLEITKLLQLIQRSFHLGGTFKVLLENTSKVVPEHLNNDVGAIIRYSGQKPEYIVPPLVPQEIFGHLITLKAAAFEQAGISMLSATAQKPAGLNSGRALREYTDIESDRFMTIGRAYEQFFLDLAKLAIECAKDIGNSFEVKVPNRKDMRSLKWSEVNLEEDQYVMQCYPVSSLPRDPSGRLETIQEYMQAGLLTPRQGKRLLDFPDLEAVESLGNAAEDYLEMILEKMVDEGEYTPPDPFDDLALAQEMAQEHYQWGKSQGLEEDRLEMLRRFMKRVGDLMKLGQPPPQAPPPGAQPQAQPQPPPQSNMVPNVPGMPQPTA